MFSTLRQARSPRRNRTIPHLECLETRFCPSGPELGGGGGGGFGGPMLPPTIAINVTEAPDHSALVIGEVSDTLPGGEVVNITGVVTATVVTEPDGTFSYTGRATGLGEVHASFVDFWGMHSNVATADLTSGIPSITDFTARDLGSNQFLFQGFVNDEYAAGLIVHLTGLASFGGGTDVAVSVDGWFSVIQNIGNDSGTAQAQTTDVWGLTSDPAYVIVR